MCAGQQGGGIAFEVDDFDASVKKLKEQKARFVLDVFSTSVCRIAVIADPDGNGIMIHKRNPKK